MTPVISLSLENVLPGNVLKDYKSEGDSLESNDLSKSSVRQ